MRPTLCLGASSIAHHSALDGLMWMVSELVPLTDPLTVTTVPFLAARWESNIGWNYWRSRHGVDDMCCWYDVLERIGYRVSEDERKALKGAYLGGGDDES